MFEKSVIPALDYIHSTYEKINELLVSKDIIKRYSTNKSDVRDVALSKLDISSCSKILELGCGYGFFIEKLKGRIASDAFITGIDIVENNREAYLNSIFSSGLRGEFLNSNVDIIKSFKTETYDLIISCYSLYFFPNLIKTISSLLKRGGVFIAVTHSKHSLREIISILKSSAFEIDSSLENEILLDKLFFAFSSEDGVKQLDENFEKINRVDYPNKMIFNKDDIDDCIYYIKQKRSLIFHGLIEKYPAVISKIEESMGKKIVTITEKKGKFEIVKDDSIFICYR